MAHSKTERLIRVVECAKKVSDNYIYGTNTTGRNHATDFQDLEKSLKALEDESNAGK